MENHLSKTDQEVFYGLKVANKRLLTKNSFSVDLVISEELKEQFRYQSGQYVGIKFRHNNEWIERDYSITSAPHEAVFSFAVKMTSKEGTAHSLFEFLDKNDYLDVSRPKGRFTIEDHPHEFRTIVGFAGGIGITPIFSHFKHILHTEKRTRLYLFYVNQTKEDIVFYKELEELQKLYYPRLEVHYFLTQEDPGDSFYKGRLNEQKLKLIINQILHLDDTDEESTIWDAVDEVLICGKGEMIKSLARACHENGIPKKNIHFELFEEFEDDIYENEQEIEYVSNIEVEFKVDGKRYETVLPDNKIKLLQALLEQKYNIPYSCKSGICGSCQCKVLEGNVQLLENEYLTESEIEAGYVLACMAYATSSHLKLDFDYFETN